MKTKSSKTLLKDFIFVCAFVVVILFMPLSGLYTLAAVGEDTINTGGTYTNYNDLTVQSVKNFATVYDEDKLVVSTHYTTYSRIIVHDPVVNISFENQTVELDDNPVIEIPTPTVDYCLDNSMDHETYSEYRLSGYFDENPNAIPDFVVIGVNANGEATDYSTSYGQAGYFTPTEKGVYTIQYTTRLRVYNPSVFAYNEGTVDDAYSGRVVNYFTELDDDYDDYGYKIKTIDETTYEVYANEQSSGGVYTYDVYTVTMDEAGNLVITDEDGADASGSVSDIDEDRYEYWQNNLIMYIYESNIFTVTVTDTTGPKIGNYDYIKLIAYEDLSKVDSEGNVVGYELKIFGIQATDASGIDYEDSSVVITTTYKYNGNTTSNTERLSGDDKIDGTTIYVTRNGTVTITYTVYDNNGNSSTATYTIRSGDSTDPIITADEDFLESSYTLTELQKNNYQFEVDTSKLTFTDDMSDAVDMIVTYVLENNDTGEEIELTDQDEYILIYTIDEVGSYTLTVTVTDEADNTTSETFDFEVTFEVTEGEIYLGVGLVDGASEEDFIKSTYSMFELKLNNGILTIDLTKLKITIGTLAYDYDNADFESISIIFVLMNNDTGKVIKHEEYNEGVSISYTIDEVGSYTFIMFAINENQQYLGEESFTFTVSYNKFSNLILPITLIISVIVFSILLGVMTYVGFFEKKSSNFD